MKLSGFAIAPGRVLGRAFVFRRAERQVPFRHLEKGAAAGERERLQNAFRSAQAELADLRSRLSDEAGEAHAYLFDANAEQTAIRMSQALSVGNDPGPAAAWLEGFLNRSGMVLLHDDPLWTMVDEWLASLVEEHFLRVVPLLRRTFATFNPHERRQKGERAQRPAHKSASVQIDADWDAARAEQPIRLLRLLLGLSR